MKTTYYIEIKEGKNKWRDLENHRGTRDSRLADDLRFFLAAKFADAKTKFRIRKEETKISYKR